MFETPGRIEPCFFEEHIPASLADLSVEIQRKAATLGQGLHPDSAAELADLVRVMNCYYSNLIEGHNTRPRDIERALAGAELEAETRPLPCHRPAVDRQDVPGGHPAPANFRRLPHLGAQGILRRDA